MQDVNTGIHTALEMFFSKSVFCTRSSWKIHVFAYIYVSKVLRNLYPVSFPKRMILLSRNFMSYRQEQIFAM